MTRFFLIIAVFLSLSFTTISVRGTGDCEQTDSIPVIPILKQLEMADSSTGARVILTNNTKVLFEKKEGVMVKGYRVKLFFDNSQSARTNAEEVQLQFLEKYPDTPVHVQYTAPYFNVMGGDFVTYQEALIFLQKVVKDFPKSFIVQQDIPVKAFGTKEVIIYEEELEEQMEQDTVIVE